MGWPDNDNQNWETTGDGPQRPWDLTQTILTVCIAAAIFFAYLMSR